MSYHFTALLRAIAEKLIPGIPEETRIAILQQTNAADVNVDDSIMNKAGETEGPTVLEDVIDKATAKSELEQEINGPFISLVLSSPRKMLILEYHSTVRRCEQHGGSIRCSSSPEESPP